jgi:hypothetical protein
LVLLVAFPALNPAISAILAVLVCFQPLIEPLLADELSATKAYVREPRDSCHLPKEYIGGVRLRTAQYLRKILDGEDFLVGFHWSFLLCKLSQRPVVTVQVVVDTVLFCGLAAAAT